MTDPSRTAQFENALTVVVLAEAGKGGGANAASPSSQNGAGIDIPGGIQLPNIIRVPEKAWEDHEPPFDPGSALRVKHAETRTEGGRTRELYDFFVNVDNSSLRSEQRAGRHEPDVLESRFIYGVVLLGLGLLEQDASRPAQDGQAAEPGGNIEEAIEHFSRGVAPVLLPMIESLGNLDLQVISAHAEEVV